MRVECIRRRVDASIIIDKSVFKTCDIRKCSRTAAWYKSYKPHTVGMPRREDKSPAFSRAALINFPRDTRRRKRERKRERSCKPPSRGLLSLWPPCNNATHSRRALDSGVPTATYYYFITLRLVYSFARHFYRRHLAARWRLNEFQAVHCDSLRDSGSRLVVNGDVRHLCGVRFVRDSFRLRFQEAKLKEEDLSGLPCRGRPS